MRTFTFTSATGAIFALTLLSFSTLGCSSVLAPRPDTANYYSLSVAAPETGQAPATRVRTLNNHDIRLNSFRLPELYNRQEIIWGTAENRLVIHENERWLEPLPAAAARIFAHDLAQALGFPWLPYPPSAGMGHSSELKLDLDITRLDIRPDLGHVRIHARWFLASEPDAAGTLEITTPLPATATPEQVAAALSTALNQLAKDTAAAISPDIKASVEKGAAYRKKYGG